MRSPSRSSRAAAFWLGMKEGECTLASASCTTGWTDWVHGELWLCPGGLLRRSLGLWQTMRHALRSVVRGRTLSTVDPSMRATGRFDLAEIAAIARVKRNRWVPWQSILSAETKRGSITDALYLKLTDGRQLMFLWLRVDQGTALVVEVLERNLGQRFVGPSGQSRI